MPEIFVFLVLLVYGYFLQLALQAYIQSLSLTACVFLTCRLKQRHHAVAKRIHVETSTWSKTVFRTRASLHQTTQVPWLICFPLSFLPVSRFVLFFFFFVSPSPPLPPALLSPTTKKGENRRPVKRRSGLSTGRPVCRGLKVDDIRSVKRTSGLSSGRPVCKWTTSALSINIQNAEHPVCKWTPKTSGL